MASPSDIRAGRAFVEIGTEDDELDSGLARSAAKLRAFGAGIDTIGGGLRAAGRFIDDVGAKIRAMGEGVALAGIAIKGGLGYALNTFATMGSEVEKASERTGVAVESLSLLSYAARRTGTDAEAMEKSIRKMQVAVADAAKGGKEGTEALAGFGLTIRDLNGLRPEQMLAKVADRLSAIPDPTARAAAAVKLFGRAGTDMLPMLQQGSKYLEQLEGRASALGLTISGTDAEAADKLNDTLGDLWDTVKMGVFNIGAALAPEMQDLADEMLRIVAGAVRWAKENKGVFVTLGHIATGVIGVGAAMVTLGTSMQNVGAILAAVSAGAGAYFVATSKTGQQAMGVLMQSVGGAVDFLRDALGTLLDDARETFTGIRAALNAGDFQAAARVLWAAVQLEFARGLLGIAEMWDTIKLAILNGWEDLKAGASKMWVGVQVGAMDAWAAAKEEGAKAWDFIKTYILGGWGEIRLVLKSIVNEFQYLWERAQDQIGLGFAKLLDMMAGAASLFAGPVGVALQLKANQVRGALAGNAGVSAANFNARQSAAQAEYASDPNVKALHDAAAQLKAGSADAGRAATRAWEAAQQALIDAQNEQAKRGNTAAPDPKLKELADAVQAAGEELDAAVAAAQDLPQLNIPDLPARQRDARLGLDEAASQLQTIARGQFGGLGAQGALSGGNGIDRIVREQQSTNRHLQAIRNQGGATFGP
jgi:hypothetical protein